MSDGAHASPGPREYAVTELTWLASQYFVKSYEHLKLLRERQESQHADMAKACCHRAAQLFLLAAVKSQGHPTPSPVGELPQVDGLIAQLDGRLRFEAEAAVRSAEPAPADYYWRDLAQGLRARFERAEPTLFTATPIVMPASDEFAPMPCPRGARHLCTWHR